ncbi:MAG: hypothetical protein V4440_03830 [Pseudomonadota bacterium]
MGCFSSEQPTYTPPKPIDAASGSDLYNQGQSWFQQNQPGLFNAQSTALKNANDPNYYAQWQPTSFEQAMGNQYFNNVWPDTQAFMKNQLSQSGFINSPGAAQAMGNTLGNLKMGIGQYLSDQGNSRATNALNAGLEISQSSMLNPFVQTAGNQSNLNTGMQNQYQQALAQQQYQQQMNQFQQQAALAHTLGQISPIGGGIYGASTGHFGDALGGTAQSFQQMMPLMMGMAGGMGGFGGMFSGGGGTAGQMSDYMNSTPNGVYGAAGRTTTMV